MAKHFKLLVLFSVVLAASGFLIFFLNKYQNTYQDTNAKEASITVPTEIKAASQEVSQESPDGKELVTLKTEDSQGLTKYTFTTLGGAFYTMSLAKGADVSIPFNTWSPDDKYFFFKQNNQFIVVSPKGEATNVSEAFAAKYPDLVLTEATGWAANTLLVLNTNKADGSAGASYWYNITYGNFTLLSNRFN
jgi:hypothetical protein